MVGRAPGQTRTGRIKGVLINKLEKDIIKQCGGFCQVCLGYPTAQNKLKVVYLDGNKLNTTYNNTRVLCQACDAKREGRPYPRIPRKKIKQLLLFDG
jgi:5-methylcytosine-specific restriction endonuclease McrA